jgi:hypothetical protein
MRHPRVAHHARRCLDAKLRRRGGDQHLPRGRAGDTHAVVARGPHRQRAAGDLEARQPGDAIRAVIEAALEGARHAEKRARDVAVCVGIERRRLLDAHESPVRIHFFRRHHGQRGLRTLAHFAMGDEHGDDVVGRDGDPRVQSAGPVGIVRTHAVPARREDGPADAEREAAARERAGADEGAASPLSERRGRPGRGSHYAPPSPSIAVSVWTALRTRANVPQRQMLVIASSTSSLVACGFSARSADTAMIMPD